jgi:hypothetical protein
VHGPYSQKAPIWVELALLSIFDRFKKPKRELRPAPKPESNVELTPAARALTIGATALHDPGATCASAASNRSIANGF